MGSSLPDALKAAIKAKLVHDEPEPPLRPSPVADDRESPEAALTIANEIASAPTSQRLLPPRPSYSITVSANAKCTLNLDTKDFTSVAAEIDDAGRSLQVKRCQAREEREVTLGLDFGTSCVKAAFADKALSKTFAVPFRKAAGIQGFLLPSRVFQTENRYSIVGGVKAYRDLKLSLLGAPQDLDIQRRVVAFLAIVIRRARGWFLTEHASVYRHVQIHWRMSLGLPTTQSLDPTVSSLFLKLGNAAWHIAELPGDVTDALVSDVLALDPGYRHSTKDMELAVIPEIAAQIYGFVVSNSFDRKAHNIYLMVDVGAGTVDASLFHVKRSRGRYNFSFFTSVVKFNGVSNLHRHRVHWWKRALTSANAQGTLLESLDRSLAISDSDIRIPEAFGDYFDGVGITFGQGVKTPDQTFASNLVRQVVGEAFYDARDRQVPSDQMSGVPFFLCGGGSRMNYYRQLGERLSNIKNYPQLSAKARLLQLPDDLLAVGLAEGDYDRLSVAYGLSQLESANVVEAEPLPPLNQMPERDWRDTFVGMDQI